MPQKKLARKKAVKQVRSRRTTRKVLRNNKGALNYMLLVILALLFFAGFAALQGAKPSTPAPVLNPTNAPQPSQKDSLQLETFYLTPSPTIIAVTRPPVSAVNHQVDCGHNVSSPEPEILVGSDPAPSTAVGANRLIRIWVNDEGAPYIAPDEVVDPATGQITTPGDRTAKDTRGSFPYLWEPAIYLTPLPTGLVNGVYTGDVENGGNQPYFPTLIYGDYNNQPPSKGSGATGHAVDGDYVNFMNGPVYAGKTTSLQEHYLAEFTWNVSQFGVTPGNYRAEIIIHDGDKDIGVDCVTFTL